MIIERIERRLRLGSAKELPPAIVIGGNEAKKEIEKKSKEASSTKPSDNLYLAHEMGFQAKEVFEYAEACIALTKEPLFQLEVERFEFGTKRINLGNGRYTTDTRLWYVHKHQAQEATPSLLTDLENRKSTALKRFDALTPEQLAEKYINFIDSIINPRIF